MPSIKNTIVGRFFVENKSIKILSLLLAVIVWYSIRGVIGVTKVVHDVPVEVRARDGIAVLWQSERQVSVTFKGAQQDIERLEQAQASGQIRAVVYARERAPAKELTIEIQPKHIESPGEVRAIRVKPDSVTIRLDEEMESQFLCKAAYKGKPAVGQVMSMSCDPPHVIIRGPKQVLNELVLGGYIAKTEDVDVAGISESFSKLVRVLSPGENWGAQIEPAEVRVRVTIEKKPAVRRWAGVSVGALLRSTAPVSVDIRPVSVDVVMSGSTEELESIKAEDFKVLVDCIGLDMSATYDLPLTVHVLKDANVLVTTEPAQVKVVLRESL